jgi:hypothetical protein
MLSVPFCGAPIETPPAATEPPVGSVCANDGNTGAIASAIAAAITRTLSVEEIGTRISHLWMERTRLSSRIVAI